MSNFTLPLLATRRNKLLLTLVVGCWGVICYGFSGKVALSLSPRTLPFTALDETIPFVPETFWIYSSVYLIYFASSYLQKDLQVFSKFLYGYVLAYAASAVFFLCFPTTFPRSVFPLGPEVDSVTRLAFSWFRNIDEPTNCFPSMHVATCVMTTLPFYKRRPRVFALFLLWTIAIGVTTLTTRQHYAADVVFGAMFGLFFNRIAFSWLKYEQPSSVRAPSASPLSTSVMKRHL